MLEREAGAYQFLDDKFEVLHTSSVPVTDEQAIIHIRLVQGWFPDSEIRYITKREINEREFKMMPIEIVNGEVRQIVRAQVT